MQEKVGFVYVRSKDTYCYLPMMGVGRCLSHNALPEVCRLALF